MNFHPPLSSAPAVLLVTGTILEALRWGIPGTTLKICARGLFLLGVAAIPLSYLSGLWAEEMLPQALVMENQMVLDRHEGLARLCLFLLVVPLLFLALELAVRGRPAEKIFRGLYFIAALCLSALIARTAFFGGELVFERGLGVQVPQGASPLISNDTTLSR